MKIHTHCPVCGKIAFPSRAAAAATRARMSERLRIYECPAGKGWHLTKQARDWMKEGRGGR